MPARFMNLVAAYVALFVVCPSMFGQEKKPTVSLLLGKVSAERWTNEVFFHCDAALVNAGKELTVHSAFNSAFDGLELVVTAPDGTVLAQRGYILHQSPRFPAQPYPVKSGRTEKTLVIPVPIEDLPRDAKAFKVRLVGTLPGSGYERVLSSETVEVRVK
jgi:hypothetical protein